jgi:hypothetical protein
MSRRPYPKTHGLNRKQAWKASPPVILVICEGKTEKKCLVSLRSRWRIPTVQVEVAGEGGVPRSVVNAAKKQWSQYGRRKSDRPETWVVFDRDEHPCWSAAIDQAHALKFKLGISNPCFELWGILLHKDQTAEIEREKAQSLLKGLHRGYDHSRNPVLDCELVLKGIDDAHDRSEELLCIANRNDADRYKNPTTRFHLLIERLRSIAAV